MPVRLLDGVDDIIVLGGDGGTVTDRSMLAVVRLGTTAGFVPILGMSAGTSTVFALLYYDATQKLSFGSTAGDSWATSLTMNTTDWFLVGFSKTGTTNPTFFLKNLTTSGTLSSTNGNASVGSSAGNWNRSDVAHDPGGTGFGSLKIAAAAAWDGTFTFAQCDALTGTAGLVTLVPSGGRVWEFSQASVATDVDDLNTVLGDDQTSITGTTVVTTDNPPNWTLAGGGGGGTPTPPNPMHVPAGMFGDLIGQAWF